MVGICYMPGARIKATRAHRSQPLNRDPQPDARGVAVLDRSASRDRRNQLDNAKPRKRADVVAHRRQGSPKGSGQLTRAGGRLCEQLERACAERVGERPGSQDAVVVTSDEDWS
jgi:hypothetical protein